jgi:cell division protease FtsH
MGKKPIPKKTSQMMFLYFGVVLVGIALFNLISRQPKTEYVPYSQFEEMGRSGQLEKVQVTAEKIVLYPVGYEAKGGISYYTYPIPDENLAAKLEEWDIPVYEGMIERGATLLDIMLTWVVPIGVFYLLWRFLMKDVINRRAGVMNFGRSEDKLVADRDTGVTFADVAGQDEAKESLQEIVEYLHNPEKFTRIGARLPKGALLVGPPGTGKTLLAKAVAGEARVPFFSMSGSEFVQMFVGVGAARVRDLFRQAQEKSPCIVFIDEIDAIGKKRDASMSSNDEREQTLNQLLSEMDGFDSKKAVVILAATNRPEILDAALLRPGRFDRRVIVDKPDLSGREAILEVHAKKIKMAPDVSLTEIARATPGATGADLANIINEAALLAVKQGHEAVRQEDLEMAVEVIIAGEVKKDRILSDHEKRAVAYHEIGHALIAVKLPNANPVHKITIVPRTRGALGFTMQLPTEEKYLVTMEEMEDQIAVMLAGRAAEEVVFGQISTGAANDIEQATETARRMVTLYGMTERFDMMALETLSDVYLTGSTIRHTSPETQTRIDEETLRIIRTQHMRAKEILKKNIRALTRAAEYLMDKETITGEEFAGIIAE